MRATDFLKRVKDKQVIYEIPESLKKVIIKGLKNIESRFAGFRYLISKGKREVVDEMLFTFEVLPPFAKEYWFFHLNSPDKRQLILSFGRSLSSFKVDDYVIDNKALSEKEKECGMFSWFFDKKKNIVFNTKDTVRIDKNRIQSKKFHFYGSYPDYELKGNFCDIKFTEPKKGKKYKFKQYFRGPFGYELVNMYFDFSGTLNKKPFKGKSYIQKVILSTPFIPWKWGRINFTNGSILNFFIPYVDLFGFRYRFSPYLEFYDSKTQKTFVYKDVTVTSEKSKWIIKNGSLTLVIRPYASHEFRFKSFGKYSYKEFFVTVEDFSFKSGAISLSDLGKGSGLFEDASGFAL